MADTLHKFQPTIVALIILLAVIVYCLFNRYDIHHKEGVVIDRLTGTCYKCNGVRFQPPTM